MLAAQRSHKHFVPYYRQVIGKREVVGPSSLGHDFYLDQIEVPCPAIRYKEPTPEFEALREKEKGNWRTLSIDEKKKLYRYSFCQTYAEMDAPTAHWRYYLGQTLFLISLPIFLFAALKKTVFPPLPDTLSDQGKKQMVRWYIDANVAPMNGGISSKWDYEKQQWKERPYWLMRSK